MTAVNANTLGDESVEALRDAQRELVGSFSVNADGSINRVTKVVNGATKKESEVDKVLGEVDAIFSKAINKPTDQAGVTAAAFKGTDVETKINAVITKLEAEITKETTTDTVKLAFTNLKEELTIVATEAKKLDTKNIWKWDTNAVKEENSDVKLQLESLQQKISTANGSVTKALDEADKAVNMQMTSLDELRTTLQGFVAKPNDVNLDHTSFTTFLDAA